MLELSFCLLFTEERSAAVEAVDDKFENFEILGNILFLNKLITL